MIEDRPCCDNCPHYDGGLDACTEHSPVLSDDGEGAYPKTGNSNLCGDHPWLMAEVERLRDDILRIHKKDSQAGFRYYILSVRSLRRSLGRDDTPVTEQEARTRCKNERAYEVKR